MSSSDKVVILERADALGRFSSVCNTLSEANWQVMSVPSLSPADIYDRATSEGFDVTTAYLVTASRQTVICCHDIGCNIVFVGVAEFPEDLQPLYVARDEDDAADFITTAKLIFGRFKVPVGG